MLSQHKTDKVEAAGGDERRRELRRRTFKGGKVIFNDRSSVISCVVRDISATGARLTFPAPQALPQRFQLQVNEMGDYDCELVRVNGTEYGVRFVVTP